jgi:uncharacterized protein YjiS (DUF1127 family)
MTRQTSTTAWLEEGRSALIAACRHLRAWRRGRQARRRIGTLQGLSDPQLRDIGLRRGESGGRFDR